MDREKQTASKQTKYNIKFWTICKSIIGNSNKELHSRKLGFIKAQDYYDYLLYSMRVVSE